MVNPSLQLDAAKNPQTRCSNCQTVFEVSRELLSSSDTRVRCGECLSIFNALDELRTPQEINHEAIVSGGSNAGFGAQQVMSPSSLTNSGDASLAGLNNDTAALDVTYSDFDLFSEEAELPEIAYFDQTRDTPEFDFDAVEMANDETFNDTLFVHDVTIDADATTARSKSALKPEAQGNVFSDIGFVADDQPREPLIFKYRDTGHREADHGNTGHNEHSAKSNINISRPAAPMAPAVPITPAHVAPVVPKAPTAAKAPSETAVSKAVNAAKASKTSNGTLSREALDDLSRPKSANPWLFRVAMFALLGVLLAALYAYRTQPQLYNSPTMRPILEAGCKFTGCSLPARVDLKSLKMVKRNVYSHPNTPNALVVNVSFRNDAEFAQQLPLLHMVLSNRVGRTVAKQNFAPNDYLVGWENGASIEAGEQLDVTLEVTDPGQDAQSFEFYFREFKT